MSDFPYTDEQARAFGRTLSDFFMGVTEPAQREFLRLLHERGITVAFPPEPRYRAMKSAGSPWLVVDTHATDNAYDDPTTVASFHPPHGSRRVGHPDPEAGARAEADRLNRETVDN